MERSFSSLTYKGSIPEAINEAKMQKKLFVVYISGEDTASNNLENATRTDLKVAESVSKYCILLHIQEGSTDTANFCAIYPQNSIPCITAIGYNGLQVWRSEGFVSAEVLASSLEKAWLSLHIRETTASVLTAALASNKSEPPTSGISVFGSSEGSSSGAAIPSPSLEKNLESSEAKSSVTSEMKNNTESGVWTTSKTFSDGQSRAIGDEHSTSSSRGADNSLSPVVVDPDISLAVHISSSAADSPTPGRTSDHHSSIPTGGPIVIPAEVNEVTENERADGTGDRKVDMSGSSVDPVNQLKFI